MVLTPAASLPLQEALWFPQACTSSRSLETEDGMPDCALAVLSPLPAQTASYDSAALPMPLLSRVSTALLLSLRCLHPRAKPKYSQKIQSALQSLLAPGSPPAYQSPLRFALTIVTATLPNRP